MVRIELDFSRPLSSKELAAFAARKVRLEGDFGQSAQKATVALNGLADLAGLGAEGLRIRSPYSYLITPINAGEVSDRRAPRRELRPPATRIVSSQGVALRLHLAALALAQATTGPGKRAHLPQMPIAEFGAGVGWTDLVATGAVHHGSGATAATVRDKKGRSVRTALDTLSAAGVVQLPGTAGRRGRHEGFLLLHEAGWQLEGDARAYVVPSLAEDDVYAVPPGFVSNGWLHVLEDTEIAVLLMVACGKATLRPARTSGDLAAGEVAIPADDRLRHYGIHRDPFSSARKTLEWFGLLGVREMGRHDDGRAEGNYQLHRLSLRPEGFDADALEVTRTVVGKQLARRGH